MACVEYTCGNCDHFWIHGPGAECPKCGSQIISADWDERDDDDEDNDQQDEDNDEN